MKIFYLSNERIPSGYANTIQQMRMCEAFGDTGLDVKLILPFYFELAKKSRDEIREFYGVKNNFKIITLPSLLSLSKPLLGEASKNRLKIPFIGGASMIASTWIFAFLQVITGNFNEPTVVYSRNINSASVFLKLRKRWLKNKPFRLVMEAHAPTQEPMATFTKLVRQVDGIISITQALKDDLMEKYELDSDKIIVQPDGVNLETVESQRMTKQQARERLGIPDKSKKIVAYCGAILPGRGVEMVVKAAAEFDDQIRFLIVGGSPQDIEALKQRTNADQLKNISFAGFKPPRLIPMYQMAADVLVLPYTSDGATAGCTSPLKLFEYMAAGRPIVASDLPVLQEILTDQKNAILTTESNPQALANGIRRALEDSTLARRISKQALIDVQEFSWRRRAERILVFLESIL